MAFNVLRKDPRDVEKRKAIGVALPFSSDSVFRPTLTTRDAIKTNLINFFSTSKGDRYMNPLFGFNLEDQLFEQMGELRKEMILSGVRDAISQYFPKVVIRVLEVNPLPEEEEHSLQVYLQYSIKDSGEMDELVVNVSK